MEIQLTAKKFLPEGDLAHEYNPLHNKLNEDGSVGDFITEEIDFNLNKPVNIECQPSYDGTVNLIINDDMNPPRIVNTRYTVLEDNRYKRIERNQTEQTNLYKEGVIDSQTRLFRNLNKIPKIELLNVTYHGQLKGGNYTFYLKLADNDFNKTDIVAESGLISIYKGTLEKLYSISGTLENERTDKAINIQINNIDTSFSKIFIYGRREFSDLNGIIKSETFIIRKPYKITSSSLLINIDGYEEIEDINEEELNIQYLTCTGVKTQAQVQNMLFFGNVQQTVIDNNNLQNLSYFIEAKCVQKEDSIGYINPETYTKQSLENIGKSEYYNPLQIYYSLGYWPTELYRFGIVYIFRDDSLSPVYNLRGCKFSNDNLVNFKYNSTYSEDAPYNSLKDAEGNIININKEDFFLGASLYLTNTKGVFKFPDWDVINFKEKKINPIGIEFTFNKDLIQELSSDKFKVKGFFFVRQRRIPTILAQAYTIGVDKTSYIPMLGKWNEKENKIQYFTESFINKSKTLTTSYEDRIIYANTKQSSGLLSVDAMVNKQLQSMFDNSEFLLEEKQSFDLDQKSSFGRYYFIKCNSNKENEKNQILSKLIYVPSDTPLKYVDDFGYSTRAGSSENAKDFKFFEEKNYDSENTKIVRGVYCPFVGTNQTLKDNTLYTIRISNYSQIYELNYFKIRGNDLSPFMAISPRYELKDKQLIHINEGLKVPTVFRGDCFTATVTVRINTNFIDSEVPINELIINPNT